MKYRLLTKEELQGFEKEFIEYLILNGITAEDWEIMKKDAVEKAEEVVKLFSDVVFEGILRKINFLEYRSKSSIITYQCLADKIVAVGMKASSIKEVDFLSKSYLKEALKNPPKGLKVYTTSKKYTKARELELFEMTQTGCEITDGKLFKTLCLFL